MKIRHPKLPLSLPVIRMPVLLHAFVASALGSSALLWGANQASAALLAYEPFDYESRLSSPLEGTGINGFNGGTGFAGPWVSGGSQLTGIAAEPEDFNGAGLRMGPITYMDAFGSSLLTSGAQVRTAGLANSWERRILAEPIGDLGSTVWLSYLGQAHGNAAASRYAFIELTNGGTSNRAWIGNVTPVATGNWGMQLPDHPGGSVFADAGEDYKMSVPTLFLVKLAFPSEAEGLTQISVWLNPASLTNESALLTPTMSFATAYSQYTHIGVAGRYSTDFDEIRLGTTFDSVTPIPEPSTYALILGAAVGGLLLLRRRNHNHS